jgi:Fe2+ or Zn2+ uptake regulation protein
MKDLLWILQDNGIKPTPQRLAVAQYVLGTDAHPSADKVLEIVRKKCPTVSRATIYNILNLLVERGLLKTQVLRGGTILFDRLVAIHHHFIDEQMGKIFDIPWNALNVTGANSLRGLEVREYQVVMRGRKKRKK